MGVLYADELEELFPVRPFLIERHIAIAHLDPADSAIGAESRLSHVVQIFIAGHRSAAECALFDRSQQFRLAARFDARCD
jgi:hypothetical protein